MKPLSGARPEVARGSPPHPRRKADPATRRKLAELTTLAEIGRAILQAQLDQDELCELIYQLAGRIVPTDESFQLGLFDGDTYRIKVWIKDGAREPAASFPIRAGEGIIGWLRQSHQSLLVHDFEAEMDTLPARPVYISANPPRAAVFIPMLVADRVIGALAIQSPRPNAFNESHVRLLAILANQSASALNNASLFARGLRRLNDLIAVSEVGRKLTSILDLDVLLTQVVELIRARFGYYHAQIFLVEPGEDGACDGACQAVFKASSDQALNEKWRREARMLQVGREGIIGRTAASGEPFLVNDVSQEPSYIPDDPRLLPDTQAELAVPIILEGAVIGVLDVQSTRCDGFGQEDVFILRTLADQVAVAISSARAYEAQREEAWVTTVLLQVAEVTSQAIGIAGVLDAAVRVIAMLAGVESTAIWLWNEEQGVWQYAASFGLSLDDGGEEQVLRFRPGDWPALDQLRATAAPVRLAGAMQPPAALAAARADAGSVLLPLVNQGSAFGAMVASIRSEPARALSDRMLAMLSGIANQVAAGVDNARLAAAREEEVWISTVLLQVAEAVRRLQPIDITLEQVTRLAPALTGVDRCAALLLDDEGAFRVRTVHASRPALAEAYARLVIRPGELPLLDAACRAGQPLMVDDTHASAQVPDDWCDRFGSRTLLVVPLLVADEPIGALLADDVDTAHMFSPRRIRILAGIANQAAIAIENARLQAQEAERARMSRELELAHDIQRNLLPLEAPTIPGYQIAYRWRSAREVGGDFFDFIPLGANRLGLVIADVSDKGTPAALYMMFARTLVRVAALSGREPAAALLRTNELILADSRSDMFVTAYYSVLDAAAHTLTYASAGHNLAFYAPAGAQAPEPLITAGIALGIIEEPELEQKVLSLAPGDVVCFYTDGAADALNPAGEAFGEERLVAVLSAQRGQSVDAIADAIEAAVREFAGDAAQYDDLTLIVVKRD